MRYSEQELISLLLDVNGIHRLPRTEFARLIRQRPYEEIFGKKTIFIDLKYWVSFRMVLNRESGAKTMSPQQESIYRTIYEKLLKLIENKTAICVVSDSILTEVEKMPLDRRLQTARIMDSLKVTVVLNGLNASTFEYINIDRITAGKEPVEQYHLSSVFEANRFLTAVILKKMVNDLDPIYNIMYDSMSGMTIEEYLKETDGDFYDSSEKFAEMMNDTKLKDTVKYTYKELLIQGLASQTQSLNKIIKYTLLSEVDYANQLPLYRKSAPFLYLHSAIHAAINFEKSRKVQKNDFYDLSHSCIGVGYADYFFTEKKFHHLLKTKPIDCTAYYKCEIYSDHAKILNVLTVLNERK